MIHRKMIILLIILTIPSLTPHLKSDTVKAQGKTETFLNCEVSTPIHLGQMVTVDCVLTPINPDADVTATFIRPNGTEIWRNMTTATGTHYYDYAYVPDTVGNWTVEVSWPGDETYEGATSGQLGFEVAKATTTLTLHLPRRSTPGTPMNLTAVLRAEDGKPIGNATIGFTVGGEKVGSAETEAQGRATLSYTPGEETIHVKAVFEGDEGYSGSMAEEIVEAPMNLPNYTSIAVLLFTVTVASVLIVYYRYKRGRTEVEATTRGGRDESAT